MKAIPTFQTSKVRNTVANLYKFLLCVLNGFFFVFVGFVYVFGLVAAFKILAANQVKAQERLSDLRDTLR